MERENGWESAARYLSCWRLLGSLTSAPPPVPLLAPNSSSWEKLNAVVRSRPYDVRLVSLACNPSYQLLPLTAQSVEIDPNMGKGPNTCASVSPVGYPA